MAKAKVRGLEEEINRVFSRYESNLKKAMQEAVDEAEFDIRFEAESCLYQYYENFQPGVGEPNIYERTNTLINAFVPYNNVISEKNSIVASVGMSYDSSKLEGVYYGSEKWSPVDGSWVLANYLAGIHPTTDGEVLPGRAQYIEIYDPVSPDEKMESYLNDYVKTFNNNVLKSFAKKVIKRR
jgi:hypothetical protein